MEQQVNHAAAATGALAATIARALRLPQQGDTQYLKQHGLGNAETVRRCTALLRDVAQRPGFEPDYGSYTAHPMDPRTPEPGDDELTEEQARDAAIDQVRGTPKMMANWLAFECSRESKPVDVQAITEYALLEASAPTLLAVLLAGDDKQAMRALHRLRDLATEQNEDQIASRTAELLHANATALGL